MNYKASKRKPTPRTVYGVSQTKPGQALIPAELLKRHLAGTLPDIQKHPEFTFDEEGVQISEDLSKLELHELHDLAKELRVEYDRRASELKDESDKAYRQQIIDEFKQSHEENLKTPPPTSPNSPAPASL